METCSTSEGGQIKLGFVEVDDMGELQSYDQLNRVVSEIKMLSRKGPVKLILFVHGWNNNASEDSWALKQFRKFLADLQDTEAKLSGTPYDKHRIFGVFVGWRGRTLRPASIGVDFYHRYQGGHRVGIGAGTDAIFEIAATAKQANPAKNVVILCGHSFGGLVLEDAISQPMRARLAEMHAKGSGSISSRDVLPADMVLFLNEAEHAVKARQLISALREREITTQGGDLPWIVSVTSQTDSATGRLFPTGVTVGRVLFPINLFNTAVSGKYRRDEVGPNAGSQHEAAKTTVGHFQPLHSHVVMRVGDSTLAGDTSQKTHILANLQPRSRGAIEFHCDAGTYRIDRVHPSARPYNTTPYWIMSVPGEVIANHGDIWTPRVSALVTALMQLRTQSSVRAAPPSPSPKQESPSKSSRKLELQNL